MEIEILFLRKILLTSRQDEDIIRKSHMCNIKANKKYICEYKGKETMPMTPFQKITEACKTTGLSQYFLRRGCRNGTVPHIKSGGVYYINVPALMEQLGKKERID